MTAPQTLFFKDDGLVPNNPLPMLFYRGAIKSTDLAPDLADAIETLFANNGWGHGQWRNGIFPFVHYHSMIHEALGIARGRAKVRFGGDKGEVVDVQAGDLALLPAGTGHQRLSSSDDLLVIGAYPPEGTYNLCKGSKSEHDAALTTIPKVPVPNSDPVLGKDGGLVKLWKQDA
jgi:uncharacterized protein YjlB